MGERGTALVAGPGARGAARWLRGLAALPWCEGAGTPEAPGTQEHPEHPENTVELRIDPGRAPESYLLHVTADRVLVAGGDAAGVFRGVQTLRQLLPPAAFRRAATAGSWEVPAGAAEDAPRFGWRGLLLDTARHFVPKDGVLRTLDLLALHKLNVLHLHLTDDQGWRMESAATRG